MTKICPNCRFETDGPDKFCGNCGSLLEEKKVTSTQPPVAFDPQIFNPTPAENNGQTNPTATDAYTPQQPGVPVDNNKKNKKAKKQNKSAQRSQKDRGFKKVLKKLIPVACIIAAIAAIWFAVGNQITLTIRTDKDLEVFNSGSLEVPGAHYNRYSELPDYVVEMLGDDPDAADYGPLMSEIVPHIRVERNKVNGWFGQKSVEYTISAPDMETWLLNIDENKKYTEKKLLADMLEYIPNAPERTQVVTVNYTQDSFFDWHGNYMAVDFANAISGGINSAYNTLYEEISADLEAALK